MARSIWSGSVSFGLVNVPVGLYTATEEHEVHFHQFERGTSSRVRYKRVNEDTGEEVDYDDIVKGAEVSDGKYAMLTQEELESVEPGKSRTIDIADFVDASEIDPIYYQKTYYLAPSDDSAKKPYALLARAMRDAERIGIATFVMRNKQYLAAIRPRGNVLLLETMYFGDEVRDAAGEIEQLPVKASLRKKDVDMAVDLVESMTTRWDPDNYHDAYTELVEELVDAKKNNKEIDTGADAEPTGKVLDLMEALQGSLDEAKNHKAGNRKRTGRKGKGRKAAKTESAASANTRDPDELSKTELYELAKESDIAGRSAMNREQLLKELRKARGKQRRKAS